MGIFRKKNDITEQFTKRYYDCVLFLQNVQDASTVTDCIHNWNNFLNAATDLDEYTKNNSCPPDYAIRNVSIKKYTESKSFYQKAIRHAIEHQIIVGRKAVKEHLNNRISVQVNLYLDIAHEFINSKEVFSEETLDFAQRMLDKLYVDVGINNISRQILLPEWETAPDIDEHAITIESIDKMNGSEFELFCTQLLRDNGFSDVELTAKSGDQGVDIIGIKDSVRYAFQCKCYDSDLSNTPVQEVFAGKEMYGCHVAVVMTNQHFTKGAQALAEKTHVLLWDREKIASLMYQG